MKPNSGDPFLPLKLVIPTVICLVVSAVCLGTLQSCASFYHNVVMGGLTDQASREGSTQAIVTIAVEPPDASVSLADHEAQGNNGSFVLDAPGSWVVSRSGFLTQTVLVRKEQKEANLTPVWLGGMIGGVVADAAIPLVAFRGDLATGISGAAACVVADALFAIGALSIYYNGNLVYRSGLRDVNTVRKQETLGTQTRSLVLQPSQATASVQRLGHLADPIKASRIAKVLLDLGEPLDSEQGKSSGPRLEALLAGPQGAEQLLKWKGPLYYGINRFGVSTQDFLLQHPDTAGRLLTALSSGKDPRDVGPPP